MVKLASCVFSLSRFIYSELEREALIKTSERTKVAPNQLDSVGPLQKKEGAIHKLQPPDSRRTASVTSPPQCHLCHSRAISPWTATPLIFLPKETKCSFETTNYFTQLKTSHWVCVCSLAPGVVKEVKEKEGKEGRKKVSGRD
jgi:hypothetical protein